MTSNTTKRRIGVFRLYHRCPYKVKILDYSRRNRKQNPLVDIFILWWISCRKNTD